VLPILSVTTFDPCHGQPALRLAVLPILSVTTFDPCHGQPAPRLAVR
jgi:hypothetical protein